MPREARPLRTSTPLPPYRAVLAVDAEKYTKHSARHQQVLSSEIRSVLEEAFRRCDLEDVWLDRRFPQSTGDGYVCGVAPEYLPLLIHPLLGHLQEALEDTQPGLATHDRDLRLRLRASIDVGPLPDTEDHDNPIAGIGRAMNDTHRLLDSDPVRAALRRSDLDITLVVAIISSRVYEEAVMGGFVGLNKRHFRPVDVQLPAKEFRQEGYVYIPQPSSRPDDPGETGEPEPPDSGAVPDPRASGPAASTTATIRDNYGQAVQGSSVHGGVQADFGGALRRRDV